MSAEKPPKTAADDRAERLAAALRANLHRRKDQKRARKAAPKDQPQKTSDQGDAPE